MKCKKYHQSPNNPKKKIVMLKNDRVQDSYEEQEFWMTKLDWVGIRLNQFEIFEEHENCYQDENNVVSSLKPVLFENHE